MNIQDQYPSFAPTSKTVSHIGNYLKIEDSKGKELFSETFDNIEDLNKRFTEITTSKKPYSFFSRTVLPARCDGISNFVKSLFVPNTTAFTSYIENRVGKVALGIISSVFDLMSLPIRLITAIPYIIYDKCLRKEEAHKIIELISENKEAKAALNEGNVKVTVTTENFEAVTMGTIDNKKCAQLKGFVLGKIQDVNIKRRLSNPVTKNIPLYNLSFDCIRNLDATTSNLHIIRELDSKSE